MSSSDTTGTRADAVPNVIGGERVFGAGLSFPVIDPAQGEDVALLVSATSAQVDDAVAAARAAQPEWGARPRDERAAVLRSVRDALLEPRGSELARRITEENGKTLGEAAAEIDRGREVVEFAIDLLGRDDGDAEREIGRVRGSAVRRPLGVVGVITPFNFPAMIPLWFVPVAVAMGNAVVVKPSEKTPSGAVELARIFEAAGAPPGLVNVVHGGAETALTVAAHKGVDAVEFVGSSPAAASVYATAANVGKRVVALGGAKNHGVVLDDADLTDAAAQIANAAFGCAGQRCMALSSVVVVDSVFDEFAERLAGIAAELRVGSGMDPSTDVGPVIRRATVERAVGAVAQARDAGATILVDRSHEPVEGAPRGYWSGPSIVVDPPAGSDVRETELFAPVVGVYRVRDEADAVRHVNASPYGNGACVFGTDLEHAAAVARGLEVGMVGVNVAVPVPPPPFAFGGWKGSIYGAGRAYGQDGVDFVTRSQTLLARAPR